MHSLWFVQWDFTRRDHPGNPGGVSGSSPVITCHATLRYLWDFDIICPDMFKSHLMPLGLKPF